MLLTVWNSLEMNEEDHLNCLPRNWSMTDDTFTHFTVGNGKLIISVSICLTGKITATAAETYTENGRYF